MVLLKFLPVKFVVDAVDQVLGTMQLFAGSAGFAICPSWAG
jgi:hypothetical protein